MTTKELNREALEEINLIVDFLNTQVDLHLLFPNQLETIATDATKFLRSKHFVGTVYYSGVHRTFYYDGVDFSTGGSV